jgi:hypothetical protein
MLTWNEILNYSKRNLGFPHTFIEYSDKEIVEYFKENCLKKFSMYFPEKSQMGIDTADPNVVVPGKPDHVYVNDPEGREILSLDSFIPTAGDMLILGHPILGSFNWGCTPESVLAQFQANNLKQFSIFNFTIQFRAPNQCRILPKFRGMASFEYSRIHAEDLSTIPADISEYFKEFCLSAFMMWIGSTRTNFANIATPFGEIPLNGSEIYSRGETKYQALIDKFESSSAPYIIMDIG